MAKHLFTFTLLFIMTFLSAQPQISLDSVSAYIGKTVKICDKVAGTYTTKLVLQKAVGEKLVTNLNLGVDLPNSKPFS